MNARSLLKNWSSLSAAAAALLFGSSSRASVDKALPELVTPKFGDGDPYEPLILKPPAVKIIPGEQFAGHRSHASHASHASHYSGSGGYEAPAATPAYQTPAPAYFARPSPPPLPAPTVYPRVLPTASPFPSASPPQTGHSPSRIEFVSGTIYYGTVLTKSAAGITIRGIDGNTYKIERKNLSTLTIAELDLPPDEHSSDSGQAGSPSTKSKDAAGSKQKAEELQQTISALRADNEALRKQLQAQDTNSKSAAQTEAAQTASGANSNTQDPSQVYWISGTGKRHNKNCRYYGTGRGHPCGPNDGVPCKICGG